MNFILFYLLVLLFPSIKISASIAECSNFDYEESRNFLTQFVSPGDLVFDVGAHEGKKTQIYLDLGARVVCFEPQPECLQRLKSTFKTNKNVIIEEVGLADADGILEFFQCSQATTISTFSKEYTQKGRFIEHNYTWDKKITAQVTTLDKMICKYGVPNFCKIDVENFEYAVLKGLSTPIRYLSFECNAEWLTQAEKCIALLKELGYKKFNFAVGERDWLLFSEWLSADSFFEKFQKVAKDPSWQECWGLWGDVYAHYE